MFCFSVEMVKGIASKLLEPEGKGLTVLEWGAERKVD